jgi:homocitrate synthase NifV
MKGIIDSTLREGEQTVGVLFSLEQKLEIVQRLARIGIEEIELGTASPYDNDLATLIKRCREMSISARLAVWCRCNKEDIAVAASAKPDVLSLSIPVSELHIKKKLGKSKEWVLKTVQESICHAKKSGIPFISLGLEDATRAEFDFTVQVIKAAEQTGAKRIRLADTVGIASPATITGLIERLKKVINLEIGVHMHNDFGMASANSIAALDAGADWVDATILGLGERAGNGRLEEVVGYLALQEKRAYRINEIPALSKLVATVAKRKIQPHQPIIGSSIFTCETGLHVHGLMQYPETYEPYEPKKVGAERRLIFGCKVGKAAIRKSLADMGYDASTSQLKETVISIRDAAKKLGRPVRAKEMAAFLSQLKACRQ